MAILAQDNYFSCLQNYDAHFNLFQPIWIYQREQDRGAELQVPEARGGIS